MYVRQFMRFVRALGVFVALALITFVLAWSGVFDRLVGFSVPDVLRGWGGDLITFYQQYKEKIEAVLWALGLLGPGGWLLLRTVVFLDRFLPEAIERFIARTDDRFLQSREPLLANFDLSDIQRSRLRLPIIAPQPQLARALQFHRIGRIKDAPAELADRINDIDARLAKAEIYLDSLKLQKATAHLLLGAIEIGKGRLVDPRSAVSSQRFKHAEDELSKALDARPNDLDALEMRAKLRFHNNSHDLAAEDFDIMRRVAVDEDQLVRAARACRGLADIRMLKKGIARREVRVLLEEAIKHLEKASDLNRLSDIDRLYLGQLHVDAAAMFETMSRPRLRADQIERGIAQLQRLRGTEVAPAAEKLLTDLKQRQQRAARTKIDDEADEREALAIESDATARPEAPPAGQAGTPAAQS